MQLSDYLSVIVALWGWSKVLTILIVISTLLAFYLWRFPGWERIKHCPRPFIIIPILTLIFIGLPVVAVYQFMEYLNKVVISCDCENVTSPIVMPESHVINWHQLDESSGEALGHIATSANEFQLTPPRQNLYKCRVTNENNVPIYNVRISLRTQFKEVIRDSANPHISRSGEITFEGYSIIPIYRIDAGASGAAVFYISNPRNRFVVVTLQEFVTFNRANSDTIETMRLMHSPALTMDFVPGS